MKLLNQVFVFIGIFTSLISYGQGSGSGSGGGSNCEIEIGAIRKDILRWIQTGNHEKMSFANKDLTANEYAKKMIHALSELDVEISCPDPKKPENKGRIRPIVIDGKPELCMNWIDYSVKPFKYHLDCDYNRFYAPVAKPGFRVDPQGLSQAQYKVIHHQFASMKNIDVEPNVYKPDAYPFSKEVITLLKKTTVYRLSHDADWVLRFEYEPGAEVDSFPVTSKISRAWSADFSDYKALAKKYTIMQVAEMQKIKEQLMLPGKEVKRVYIQTTGLNTADVSKKVSDCIGSKSFTVSDADTDRLLFTMKIYIEGTIKSGRFDYKYHINKAKIPNSVEYVMGKQFQEAEKKRLKSPMGGRTRAIGRGIVLF
jgi:hypothetical protein